MLKILILSLFTASLAQAQPAARSAAPTDDNTIDVTAPEENLGPPPSPDGSKAKPTPPKYTIAPSAPPPLPPAPAPPPAPRIQQPPEQVRHNEGAADEIEKPSAEQGEKIFDWSKYKDATEVPHPFAEKGLFRISKERDYYYRVKETPTNRSANLNFGMFAPSKLSNPDESGRGSTFGENYNSTSNPTVLYMYEWDWFRSALGKVGFQAGSGIFGAQGHGHFVGTINQGLTPRENFTFLALPNSAGLVYHMEWGKRQFLVPYGGGGLSAIAISELRDDNKGPKFAGTLDGYFFGGLAISLTYYDYLARIQLNREYGINSVYLTLEYRYFLAIMQRYDFTTPFANAGFTVEY